MNELQNTTDQASSDLNNDDAQENEISIDELKDQEVSEDTGTTDNSDQ